MGISAFLKKYGVEPDVWLDQCFMADDKALELVAKSSHLKKGDVVLEIGGGTGLLTKRLAKRAKKVVSVEKDEKLAKVMLKLFRHGNVEIVNDDIIKYGLRDYKIIVSNLPYAIIDWFFKALINHSFTRAVVTVSSKSYKKIAEDILIEAFLDVKKVADIKRESFYPVPSVDSVLLFITPKDDKDNTKEELALKGFYRKNKDKKVSELAKNINERESNKKVSDLSGKEIVRLISSLPS